MFSFVYSLVLLTAEVAHTEKGGFVEFYEKYLNYPGFEAWKFVNLGIFVAIIVYLVKKPLSEAFKAKREAIRAELIKAEEEKQAVLSKLASAEARLVSLENEKAAVLKKANDEAAAETARLAEQAEIEVQKMHEQTAGEISRLSQHTLAQLRKFSAEESVRLAEEKLREKINADSDLRLVKAGIEAIGGMN